jgi:hypothetical protein
MKISNHFLSVILVLMPVLLMAQPKLYQRDTSIRVFANGKEQTMPWCGGFNNPQFAMADLNNDGLQDLVVFENWNSLRTFINTGTAGNPRYTYAPEYAYNFPPIFDYCILADYNRDGIADLFEQGQYGFAVYRGYYNDAHQLSFAFYMNIFYSNDSRTHGFPANAFDNPGDIPAVVDVDGDGDLDLVAYNIQGGNINFYKNRQVEDGLPNDTIRIGLWDNCWGKVYQGYYRTHTLAYSCDNSALNETYRMAGGGQRVTHSGNTPCLFDYDGDGDYDYLDGNISFNQMTFLLNGRIPDNPTGPDSMVAQDTMWQSISDSSTTPVQINIATWAAAFNVDIDQDGKKDLLVTPSTSGGENYHCVWFYKNMTTPGHPDWQFESDTFLVDNSIDLGSSAYPMLFDYNKDGLLDLFVGSDGYFDTATGTLKSKISYYQNTGSPGNPIFTLVTKDFMGLSIFNFEGAAPSFGDINNDGTSDLIIGHTDGSLSYFKNWAGSDTVTPIWELNELMLTDVNNDTINVSGYAAPFMYDINKDGKKDLVIGNTYGTLQYYRNVDTVRGQVALQFVTASLGNIQADPHNNFGIYSTVFIGRIDTSHEDYLLMGGNSGNVYLFTGFQDGNDTGTYVMLDSQYSYLDTFDNLYNNPGTDFGLYSHYRTSLTVGDVGADGSYEMITGDSKGGCNLYKWKTQSTVGTAVIPSNEAGSMKVFPNPTGDLLTVSWSGVLQPNVDISIISIDGRQYYTATEPSGLLHVGIPVSALPPGMYVCQLQSGVNRYYSKFTVVR